MDDNELSALVQAHRRHHGLDEDKGRRKDYLDRTIRRARALVEEYNASEDAAAAVIDGPPPLDDVFKQIGIGPFRIIKHPGDEPTYWLQLETGEEFKLGPPAAIRLVNQFRDRVAGATNHLMSAMAQPAWDRRAKVLFANVLEVDAGPDARRRDRVAQWVEGYLEARNGLDDVEGEHAADSIAAGRPLLVRTYVAITAQDLARYLRDIGERRTNNEICEHLRAAGWEPYPQKYRRRDGRMTTKSYYRRELEDADAA